MMNTIPCVSCLPAFFPSTCLANNARSNESTPMDQAPYPDSASPQWATQSYPLLPPLFILADKWLKNPTSDTGPIQIDLPQVPQKTANWSSERCQFSLLHRNSCHQLVWHPDWDWATSQRHPHRHQCHPRTSARDPKKTHSRWGLPTM